MKKVFISFSLALILFLAGIENIKACDFGYTEYTQTINFGGCDWTVIFCVKCSPSHSHNEIWLQQFSIPNSTCYSYFLSHSQEVINRIIDSIGAIGNEICGEKPPCSGQLRKFSYIYLASCWQTRHVVNQTENYFEKRFCDDSSFCRTETSTCWDYSTTPPTPVVTTLGKTQFGTISCNPHNDKPGDFDFPSPNNTWSSCWEEFECIN